MEPFYFCEFYCREFDPITQFMVIILTIKYLLDLIAFYGMKPKLLHQVFSLS